MSIDPSLLEDEPPVDETSKTSPYLVPVFMGERVQPWPADRPVPPKPQVPCLGPTRNYRGVVR